MGEAMINCIKYGDQPLPRVTQVSIARTSSTEEPPLKDKSMWSDQEKKIQKIDRLARSLSIQDFRMISIPSLIATKLQKTYEMLLLDICLKCGYSKDNCELNFKFLNNLQPEWKQYATMMRQNKNLMDINIDALYNILKQNQGDVNDAMGIKKIIIVVTSDPLALIDEKKQDMSKVKCYNCKKEHVWMESSSDSDQEINSNMVFMAQIEKVFSDSEASSSSADDKISEVSYYLSKSESESEYMTSEYYDNTTTYGLFVNDNDDQEIFHDCENFSKNLIKSQIDHNKSAVDHNVSEGIDKLIRKFNKKIAKCLKHIEKSNQQNKCFKNQNKDLQDKYDVLKNQATIFEMKNNELNEQMKVLIEKNDDLLA
uniref:Uncharacterized protein n=1 Tax=Tanacetum cinerariifolium TaxID=118510 RepID=A0A699I0E9_TANCI|nr:hypothetical protein [Tanacetum cinerariifolium]